MSLEHSQVWKKKTKPKPLSISSLHVCAHRHTEKSQRRETRKSGEQEQKRMDSPKPISVHQMGRPEGESSKGPRCSSQPPLTEPLVFQQRLSSESPVLAETNSSSVSESLVPGHVLTYGYSLNLLAGLERPIGIGPGSSQKRAEVGGSETPS